MPQTAHDTVKNTDTIISRAFSADITTPISALFAIRQQHPDAILLESLADKAQTGRYSHIGFDCIENLLVVNNQLVINDKIKGDINAQNLLPTLKHHYAQHRVAADDKRVAIIGGLVGYFHYESVAYFEDCLPNHSEADSPTIQLKSFANGLTFDHQTQEMIVSVRVNQSINKDQAEARIKRIFDIISSPIQLKNLSTHDVRTLNLPEDLQIDVDDDAFKNRVNQAKQHILDGDVFQVVISRRFRAGFDKDPLEIYRALRHLNPSPYMFYLPMGESTIVGASPEKLVSLHEGILEVNPLAGTRPRGEDIDETAMANELLSDKKEIAEHMMLVDLARNDLGRIAKIGSVNVKDLMQLKKYRHVMHISSQVNATILPELDGFDALAATFPAGTLSGAPKIRAMEIIHELERNPRELYGGAVVMFDGNHNVESCIAIRMAHIKDNIATVRTGAGIVYDSQPQAEADETKTKARSVLKAIQLAKGGLS